MKKYQQLLTLIKIRDYIVKFYKKLRKWKFIWVVGVFLLPAYFVFYCNMQIEEVLHALLLSIVNRESA